MRCCVLCHVCNVVDVVGDAGCGAVFCVAVVVVGVAGCGYSTTGISTNCIGVSICWVR